MSLIRPWKSNSLNHPENDLALWQVLGRYYQAPQKMVQSVSDFISPALPYPFHCSSQFPNERIFRSKTNIAFETCCNTVGYRVIILLDVNYSNN